MKMMHSSAQADAFMIYMEIHCRHEPGPDHHRQFSAMLKPSLRYQDWKSSCNLSCTIFSAKQNVDARSPFCFTYSQNTLTSRQSVKRQSRHGFNSRPLASDIVTVVYSSFRTYRIHVN